MKSILFVISLSYISWISDKDMNKGWLSCLVLFVRVKAAM